MTPYYQDEQITLYHGDCREIVPTLDGIDALVTDPPYPDYHVEQYRYDPKTLLMFDKAPYRQFIFWSAKASFPLSYSAVHVWDKRVPTTPYERIFERNGATITRKFRHYFVNSSVAASFTGNEWTRHPSQKPIALMDELVRLAAKRNQLILDPFAGSGSTLKAAKLNGRMAIGIEIEERWCEQAAMRLQQDYFDLGDV